MSATGYREFLESKIHFSHAVGFDVAEDDIHAACRTGRHQHQAPIIRWALKKGRCGLFCAFGLGKTIIQTEILRIIQQREGGRQLLIAPLAVRGEFRHDTDHVLGLGADFYQFVRRTEEVKGDGCYLTNYESVRDGKLDVNLFTSVSLDEASVLRSYGSKTYQTFLSLFDQLKYRFVATATPSPNRYKELIHYAGFLGVMDTGQALAQPLSSNVLTPSGWRRMGDVRVGDRVIGRNGRATEVIGVYPQGPKPINRVTFSDGASARCTTEHLWLTRTQYERNAGTKFSRRNPEADASHYWTVKETSDIADTLRCESTGARNHQIPLVEAVEFDPKPYPVDPYLLGLLLGDGHLRETSVNLTTADQWIVEHVRAIVAPLELSVRKSPHARKDGKSNYDYSITGGNAGRTGRSHHSNNVLNGIRACGLIGKRAWEKRIPPVYLFNSMDVRLSVLQGLMDADGTISADVRNRTTRLCTTSSGLAEDAVFIVQSLGGTATVAQRKGRTPQGQPGRMQYIVTLRLPNGYNPFRLPRKADLVLTREKYTPKRYITSVVREGTEEAQCIAVADPEHLYVTDQFVVTHNTRFFQRDSTQANNLTLYPHMEREFFLWLHSWALFVQTPSDLGFSDDGYQLPPMEVRYHELPTPAPVGKYDRDGQAQLIADAALSLKDAATEKRESIDARVIKAIDIVKSSPDDHMILWHHLESERHAIKHALPEAVSVYGTQDLDEREQAVADFSAGRFKYLSTKPELAGSGCNFQRYCHRAVFLGVNYQFNDLIQSCYRIQRFLQDHPVVIDIIHTEAEREVVKALQAKWAEDTKLRERMSAIIRKFGLSTTGFEKELTRSIGVERTETRGERFRVVHNDCVDETRRMEAASVDLIHTSIPFGNHYEYSASYNDFGHNSDNKAFFRQMDYLTPELLRVLRPGRIAAIHVKDRIRFGNVTGYGMPSVDPFHADCIAHYRRHGFIYMGMITVVTDVVRENNQTYRLGWSENCKDGTKMGVGSPEYVLLFRKLPSDTSKGYADVRVAKSKEQYTRARWQLDAHAYWRSSGNRFLTAEELSSFGPDVIGKMYEQYSLNHVYDFAEHVAIGQALEDRGALPATFMCLAPPSHDDAVWTDVTRMQTLNGEQTRRGLQNHICPLQFDVVDRIIERYTNPGEVVYDPFAGIGTVPVRALKLGRIGWGVELAERYYADAVRYAKAEEEKQDVPSLFDTMAPDMEGAV